MKIINKKVKLIKYKDFDPITVLKTNEGTIIDVKILDNNIHYVVKLPNNEIVMMLPNNCKIIEDD